VESTALSLIQARMNRPARSRVRGFFYDCKNCSIYNRRCPVWDAKISGQQLSVALGHGTTHASDRWALRVGIELDD
jgi:hypothetical protein